MTRDEPEGRSYQVVAPDAALARRAARDIAADQGHPGAYTASVLHVERLTPGWRRGPATYEVCLAVKGRP